MFFRIVSQMLFWGFLTHKSETEKEASEVT